jgi:hypothetical protein
MKFFIDDATEETAPEHARIIIESEAAKGVVLALVKIVRLAKGILLFFDRDEWQAWAADKTAEKGIYEGKSVG